MVDQLDVVEVLDVVVELYPVQGRQFPTSSLLDRPGPLHGQHCIEHCSGGGGGGGGDGGGGGGIGGGGGCYLTQQGQVM